MESINLNFNYTEQEYLAAARLFFWRSKETLIRLVASYPNLSFSDEGIGFKTNSINATVAWSLYTGVIESEAFYLLIYGKDIGSISIVPKRVFRDAQQEGSFREMLRRNIDRRLPMRPLSDQSASETEYSPTKFEPPDWR